VTGENRAETEEKKVKRPVNPKRVDASYRLPPGRPPGDSERSSKKRQVVNYDVSGMGPRKNESE